MPDQPAARSLALPVLDADVTRRRFLLGLVTTTAAVAAGNVLGLRAAHAAVPIPAALPVGISPDVDGVSTEARPGDGNFDGAGWAYAAELLPPGRTTIGGVPFDFPANYADGSKNFLASNGQTLALPAGKHALVYLVGAAHHGAVDAKATVTYTDGSTAAVPFQFTDWAVSPRFGEAIAVQCPYRHDANGRTSPPVALFLQTIPLDPAKEARSLTLPQAPNAKLIAATVQPAVQGVAVKIIGTGSTDLFVGTEATPRQVVRVSVVNVGSAAVSADAPALVTL